jgi:hypothetical protein
MKLSKIYSAVFLATVFISVASFAASVRSSCLQSASDQEILNELSYRLSSGGQQPPINSAQVTASCDFAGNYSLSVTNLESGKEEQKSYRTGTSDLCNSALAVVRKKVPNSQLNQNTVVGSCDFSGYLSRMLLKTTGQIQDLGIQKIGTSDKCLEALEKL